MDSNSNNDLFSLTEMNVGYRSWLKSQKLTATLAASSFYRISYGGSDSSLEEGQSRYWSVSAGPHCCIRCSCLVRCSTRSLHGPGPGLHRPV
ncbi:hypothetical protein RRG08_003857 [Elysia crispata]|uniref:Uncharacterized protein n=1 Tax=Elysia crispata TaxID=231223 RepID=A0AAE1DEI2_9GAST|nr:hypothetical protein RRG08_003857 [Elysia crispata]